MRPFKKGDIITLKKEFYKEPCFKKNRRTIRKFYASLLGEKLTVSGYLGEDYVFVRAGFGVVASLFEKVQEKKEEQKENPKDFKAGMYAKVINSYKFGKIGKIIKIVDVNRHNHTATGEDGWKYCWDWQLELLPDYVPPIKKRVWTEAEIAEAKIICYDALLDPHAPAMGIINRTTEPFSIRTKDDKVYTSKCCPTDTPNEHIGRMVTFCKATGRQLPAWIKEK